MLRTTGSMDSTVEYDVTASCPLGECHAVRHLFGWECNKWDYGIPAVVVSLSNASDRC